MAASLIMQVVSLPNWRIWDETSITPSKQVRFGSDDFASVQTAARLRTSRTTQERRFLTNTKSSIKRWLKCFDFRLVTYSNRFDFEWTSSQFFFKFRISMGFQTFFGKKNPTEFPMSSAWSALAWSYCHIAPHLQDSRTTSLQRKNLLNPKVSRRISWTFSQFETRVKTKKHLQHVSCIYFCSS